MKTTIKNVTESNTYKVYQSLLNSGFNAKIVNNFSMAYNKDNRYLAVLVKECEDRLPELFNKSVNFEIILSKNVNDNNVHFEIRKYKEYVEFISEDAWNEFLK